MNEAVLSRVWAGAQASLEANIESVGSKKYVTAGRHQFRSLWARDFFYSVRGLLVLKKYEVVRDQLTLLLDLRKKNKDGSALIARTADSTAAKWRVAREVVFRYLPPLRSELPLRDALKPEFINENGTEVIDSNILLLLAALLYLDKTGDTQWWTHHESSLVEVYRYYDLKISDGLILQPGFSDWQDSVRRSGAVFLTNLLYWYVSSRLIAHPRFEVQKERVEAVHSQILRKFSDPSSGLYFSVENQKQISIDGILMAIELGFVQGEQARKLFEALQNHTLWKSQGGLPGFATFPDYDARDVSWTTKVVGLNHYHDRLYWSWLMGFSLKIALRFKDRVAIDRLMGFFDQALIRDGAIVEVYQPSEFPAPWGSIALDAERPFSWGAAYLLDALAEYREPRDA